MVKYPTWNEIVERMSTKYGITVDSTECFSTTEITTYVEEVANELTEDGDNNG